MHYILGVVGAGMTLLAVAVVVVAAGTEVTRIINGDRPGSTDIWHNITMQ